MKKLLLTTFMVLLAAPFIQAQVITVSTTEYTHEELVLDVLIDSPCAIVDNIDTTTGTDFGFASGIGYFENTNPNFPMETGVILATGNVMQAPGPNNDATWGTGGWPGDTQLFDYIQSLGIDPELGAYNDASIMEFDFTPLTDSISFNFVFGSNEYGTFQCGYSDAFAFFLENQDTGEVINMALVPDTPTETPISVTTIRDNAHNGTCSSENEEYFDVYYGTTGEPSGSAPVDLNGHTVLMQAWQYVEPNAPYRMKLVIADRGPNTFPEDNIYDSAVFIEGGSFFIGNADLGDDVTIDNGTAICDNEELILTVEAPEGSEITWFFNGEVIPGETGTSLVVTEPGLYGVEISNPDAPDCIITDEIEVEFKTSPIVDLGEDILVCGEVEATLDGTPENIADLGDVSYVWFYNGVEIPDETEATIVVTEIGEYTVEVTTELDCVGTDTIEVVIADFSVDLGADVFPCDEEEYLIEPTIGGVDPSEVDYMWSTGETSPTITVTTSGTYSLEITYLDCTESDEIVVTFRDLPEIELGQNVIKCAQDEIVLDATPSNSDSDNIVYTWYVDGGFIEGETGSTLTVVDEGLYEVEVNDEGCISTDEIEVSFYDNENCVITEGISPNGDGENECLDLTFLSENPGIQNLKIFNRYGSVVFDQDNYVNQWCGQSDNQDRLPVGTYFYLITLDGEPERSGYIYINY